MVRWIACGLAVVLAALGIYRFGPWSGTPLDPAPRLAAPPLAAIAPAAPPAGDSAGIIPPSPPKPAGMNQPSVPVRADVAGAGTALLQGPPLQRWTGDLDGLQERKVIRVLVTYNRTNFFIQDGLERGFEHELIQQLAGFLHQGIGEGEQPFTVVTLPVPFGELIPRLLAGEGDIAAAGLTITPEREELVGFTAPYLPEVSEILITAAGVSGIETLEDLAGRKVHVAGARSYGGHLRALSERLEADGKPPIAIVEVDPHLETEDLLQLVNTGMIELTVADAHIGQIWADSLPRIVLREDLEVHQGGRIAWAIRPDSPLLRAELDRFMADHQRGTLIGNVLFERYFEDDGWISQPLAPEQQVDLARYADLFIEYGRRYGFDWKLIAAVAFQESKLDQSLVSGAGAVGLMQIKPDTAAEPAIGLPGVGRAETNVHAGVKYLAYLKRRYFEKPGISPAAQIDFTLAPTMPARGAWPRCASGQRSWVSTRTSGSAASSWSRSTPSRARRRLRRQRQQVLHSLQAVPRPAALARRSDRRHGLALTDSGTFLDVERPGRHRARIHGPAAGKSG